MTETCQWLRQHLEDFFCDRLTPQDHGRARAHIDECSSCRDEVRALERVDRLVRRDFSQRLREATAPRRVSFVLPAGIAAAATAVLVVALVSGPAGPGAPPAPDARMAPAQVAQETPPVPVVKSADAPEVLREKPAADSAAPSPSLRSTTATDGQPLLVTDAAGYSFTLESFRGSILILGVWDAQSPSAGRRLQDLYDAFSDDPNVKILGVPLDGATRPSGTTLPTASNQGSALLDTKAAQFVVVDARGAVRLRGSLFDDRSKLIADIGAVIR